jgi:hypothetical protein
MFEYEQAGLPQPVDQADYMASAWFADDGAIFESRIPVLQQMVDCLAVEFNRIGLLFNVPKTKWLVVAPATVSGVDEADHILPSAYLALQAQLRQTPLRVGGEVIEMVSHFRYLGVKVSWRWDFASAWREATKSARAEVLRMIRSGIHNWGVSMDALLDFIRGKVSCHFNYLAAIAGGGGLPSAAHWAKADDVMTLALRVVLGYRFADGDSLKAETGTWPIQVRTKMLMLRFYCKILTLDRSAPLYRAIAGCLPTRRCHVFGWSLGSVSAGPKGVSRGRRGSLAANGPAWATYCSCLLCTPCGYKGVGVSFSPRYFLSFARAECDAGSASYGRTRNDCAHV